MKKAIICLMSFLVVAVVTVESVRCFSSNEVLDEVNDDNFYFNDDYHELVKEMDEEEGLEEKNLDEEGLISFAITDCSNLSALSALITIPVEGNSPECVFLQKIFVEAGGSVDLYDAKGNKERFFNELRTPIFLEIKGYCYFEIRNANNPICFK